MDIEKLEIHIRNWLIITFFLIANIIFFIVMVDNFLLPHLRVISWPSSWDLLAFFGAIIGGLLTLLGVRQTIKSQNRKDILDRYPEKLLSSDNVQRIMNELIEILSGYIRSKEIEEFEEVQEVLNTFYKEKFEKLKIESSKVSGSAFEFILQTELRLNMYENLLTHYLEEDISFEELSDRYYDWYRAIEVMFYEFQMESEEIYEEYSKHFKSS